MFGNLPHHRGDESWKARVQSAPDRKFFFDAEGGQGEKLMLSSRPARWQELS